MRPLILKSLEYSDIKQFNNIKASRGGIYIHESLLFLGEGGGDDFFDISTRTGDTYLEPCYLSKYVRVERRGVEKSGGGVDSILYSGYVQRRIFRDGWMN